MLPFIIAGSLVAAAAAAAYKYFDEPESNVQTASKSLGSFVIWGLPNVGKTTFITRLRGEDPHPNQKEVTDSKKKYTNIRLNDLEGGPFVIEEIVDMPGNRDRKDDWLKLVVDKKHVFYLIDLSRLENSEYRAEALSSIKETVTALKKSDKKVKRINLIATHLDKSKWNAEKAAEVNNKVQQDDEIRLLYESTEGVAGYVYSANLMDKASFQKLLQSIVNDCQS